MVEKGSGNQSRMNNNSKRRGGRGSNSSNRHLRTKGTPFNAGGSSSLNWRNEYSKSNLNNEANNYGYNNHHLTSAFLMLIGLKVRIQKTDGSIYEGILEAVSTKNEFHLSHVTKPPGNNNENGDVSNSQDPFQKAIFLFSDIVYCKAVDVDLDFARRDVLLTDSAISGSNGPAAQRELVMWKPDEGLALSSEALDGLDTNDESWGFDAMINAHEEKHGVTSTFDSSMSNYMTPIEKRDDEEYKEQERRAEQIAREIQNSAHHKELEMADSGAGEEEMFSSVSRLSANNKLNPVANDVMFTSATRNNTNNNNTNNEGIPSYNRSYNQRRGGKAQNTVGPRLQRNNRNQEGFQNGPNSSNVSSNRSTLPPRSQNGNASRNNGYQHPQQIDHHKAPADNVYVNSAQATLSYSAVAMKTQPVQNNRDNPRQKATRPPQPLMQQQVTAPSQQTAVQGGMVPANSESSQLPAMSEALAAAKKQMINNSRNYASMTQSGLTHPQISTQGQHTTQMSTSQGQNTTQISTSQHAIQSRAPPAVEDHATHQHPHTTESSPERQRLAHGKEADKKLLLEQKCDTRDFPSKGLSKYGKINPPVGGEEEKKPSINELKDFKNNFQLNVKTASSSNTPVKSKFDEKEPVSEVVSKSTALLTESIANTSLVDSVTPSRTVVSTTSSTSSTSAPSTTATTSAPSQPLKSSLNPAAKEFNFNPTAKEFTPGTAGKSGFVKQSSFPTEGYNGAPPPQYVQTHPGTVVASPHPGEVMQQPQVMKQAQQLYRYQPTVFSIHAGEYANQGGGQIIQPSYIQNQGMPNHQPQVVYIPGGYHQSVVPGPQGSMQSLIPMQSPMMRYIPPQHAGNAVPQASNRFHHPEGVQGGYLITANQHGGILSTQPVASNQHNFSTPPSPSPHIQQQQQYVFSANNYSQHQVASPINHPQGGGPPNYRTTAPMQSVSSHPGQQLVMMGQHVPGVAMQPGQSYMQGHIH